MVVLKQKDGPRHRGRPPGPKNRARTKRVVTFVTEPELSRLQAMAVANGASLSATTHHLIARALKAQSRALKRQDGKI